MALSKTIMMTADGRFRCSGYKGFQPGSNLGAALGKLLFLAYDLDRFAELLEDLHFRTFYEIDEAMLRQRQTDDEALLRLAFRYIRSQMDEFYPLSRQ